VHEPGLKAILARLADGQDLCPSDAQAAFSMIMDGRASEAEIAAFVMGLRVKGETIEEIAAGVRVLRDKMVPVAAASDAIDCCGTGGDAQGTYNVSTAAAFVLAGGGVRVAKHGNRAVSSKSGAADVLLALGVKIDVPPAVIARAIQEARVGFMMAPYHHSAMKHVAQVRGALGIRTIFNLMGPLANPAGVRRQLVGVFSPAWVEPIAQTLAELGAERAWVVHGQGLDELTTTGPSIVAALEGGRVRTFEVNPSELGFAPAQISDLVGGAPVANAAKLKSLLAGEKGPYRDIVILNAAAAFILAGKATSLAEGVGFATIAIDDGSAARALDALVAITNGTA
jgi:anthranilate phosphoribosyltransferase